MKRDERLAFIAEVISKAEIKTQDDLVQSFEKAGNKVTQATISRDIKSLALVKVPSPSGGYRYALPAQEGATATTSYDSNSLMSDAVFEVKRLDKMLSIHAKPGTTAFIKRRLLEVHESEIFSLLVDDDSLLLIANSEAAAEQLYQELKD